MTASATGRPERVRAIRWFWCTASPAQVAGGAAICPPSRHGSRSTSSTCLDSVARDAILTRSHSTLRPAGFICGWGHAVSMPLTWLATRWGATSASGWQRRTLSQSGGWRSWLPPAWTGSCLAGLLAAVAPRGLRTSPLPRAGGRQRPQGRRPRAAQQLVTAAQTAADHGQDADRHPQERDHLVPPSVGPLIHDALPSAQIVVSRRRSRGDV
jgi:hypothetical protein